MGSSVNRYALPVLTERTFINPLRFDDGSLPTNPDPFVTRYRGRYYCVASDHRGVRMSRSDDLVSWHTIGLVLSETDRCEYWAPCLARIDGRFYIYYSSRPEGSDDPHEEALHVASSDSIEGPYVVEHRFFDTFAIDPHVVRDPAGDWVMFYSTNEPTGLESEVAGTSILVDRLLTPTQLEGRPVAVVVPSIDEEIFERNRFGSDRDWYTIEGASYFSHHGRAFLTYSGNAYVGEDYFIGYSSADSDGAVVDHSWKKHPSELDHEPLVRRNSVVEGTGHNSVVSAPNLVDDWIVYHGRDAAEPIVAGTEQRVMRIDPMFYSAGTLTTCAPSFTTQDAPAQPGVAARFDGAAGLPEGWEVAEGAAGMDGETLRAHGDANVLVIHPHRSEGYVAEVWVQATRTDAGARAGVVPWYVDEDTFIEACIDAASAQLIVRKRERGFTETIGSWPVDATSLGRWSIVRFSRVFDTVRVSVDDRDAGSFVVPRGAASVGLRAVRTAAQFSAFALTDHLALAGEDMRFLPRLFRADRPTPLSEDGAASRSRGSTVLVGETTEAGVATTYEFALDASWSAVDVFPLYYADGDYVRVHLDAGGYRVETSTDGTVVLAADGLSRRSAELSVRTQVVSGGIVIRIDDVTVHVAFDPTSGATQRQAAAGSRRVHLTGSRLRSLDQTAYRLGSIDVGDAAVSDIPHQ
jgi:GH43 family beta-xylosidase